MADSAGRVHVFSGEKAFEELEELVFTYGKETLTRFVKVKSKNISRPGRPTEFNMQS